MKNKINIRVLLIGLIAGLANGLFGSGGGTILVPGLVFFLKVEDHKAHATAISVILPLSLISAAIYYRSNVVDFGLTFKVIIGSVIGGFIGSNLLNRIPVRALRKIFGILMLFAAIRMVF